MTADGESRDSDGLVELLSGQSTLRQLSSEALSGLSGNLRKTSLSAGDVLFRQGDPGGFLCFVCSGRLQASIADRKGKERDLGEAGPGSVVGEVQLLSGGNRMATVTCIEDAELLSLDKDSFNDLARRYPRILDAFNALFRRRMLQEQVRRITAR
ncbi:MAG: Crp/Fnr family transcriptional regulator [Desulfatibacillaceae bacterium]